MMHPAGYEQMDSKDSNVSLGICFVCGWGQSDLEYFGILIIAYHLNFKRLFGLKVFYFLFDDGNTFQSPLDGIPIWDIIF